LNAQSDWQAANEKIARAAFLAYGDELLWEVPLAVRWEDLPEAHRQAWRVVSATVRACASGADVYEALPMINHARGDIDVAQALDQLWREPNAD